MLAVGADSPRYFAVGNIPNTAPFYLWQRLVFVYAAGFEATDRMAPADSQTIDRDAADKAKGVRLQRLRAVALLLDAISRGVVQVYCAIECDGDVFKIEASESTETAYSEEDKNYASGTTFTLASDAVLNTLVIFIDIWINSGFADTIALGFYTPCLIAKERTTQRIKTLGIVLPVRPILEALQLQDLSDKLLLKAVQLLVIDEYKSQYSSRKSKGNQAVLEQWTDADWITFLKKITWYFGTEDEQELKKTLLKKIKECPHGDSRHADKLDIILAYLLDLFDERQIYPDRPSKFVHKSDVHNVFLRIASGDIRRNDPTWQQWDNIPRADSRNLEQKIRAVCASASTSLVGRLSRKVAASLSEQKELEQDKRLRALKYQVYDRCLDELEAHIPIVPLSEEELEKRFRDLFYMAVKRVEQRAADYHYPLTNSSSISDLVLELFDSCFLSLDGK